MQSVFRLRRVGHPLRTFFKNCYEGKLKDETSASKTLHKNVGKYRIVEPAVVSEISNVPEHIPMPTYNESSTPETQPKRAEIKDKNQIECMRDSCHLAKEVLKEMFQYVKPGVTTDELDKIAHEMIVNNGAYPSPLKYRGFPKSICTSINNVVCHGIPDSRPLERGDILNVDLTVYLNGYHGDCSAMFEVGNCDFEVKRLIHATHLCLMRAIDICKPNEDFCNIGNIIEETANMHGFNVIPSILGHGIGQYFHGPPDIYHVSNDRAGKMHPGMTFTIEPALTQGSTEVEILEDGWTVVTVDNARTAQIEHTILITEDGCDVLTY